MRQQMPKNIKRFHLFLRRGGGQLHGPIDTPEAQAAPVRRQLTSMFQNINKG